MGYIIQSNIPYTTKNGKKAINESFFIRILGGFPVFGKKDEAKIYDFKKDALFDLKKRIGYKPKFHKVIKD